MLKIEDPGSSFMLCLGPGPPSLLHLSRANAIKPYAGDTPPLWEPAPYGFLTAFVISLLLERNSQIIPAIDRAGLQTPIQYLTVLCNFRIAEAGFSNCSSSWRSRPPTVYYRLQSPLYSKSCRSGFLNIFRPLSDPVPTVSEQPLIESLL